MHGAEHPLFRRSDIKGLTKTLKNLLKIEVVFLRPILKDNIEEIIKSTKFMKELEIILYGARLAMKYSDATDTQISQILNKIVLNAFSTLELDYDSMYASVNGAPPLRTEEYVPAADDNTLGPFSQSNTYDAMNADYDGKTNNELDIFNNPVQKTDMKLMYQMSEKAYDSRMDDDEDLERIPIQAFQHEF